MATGLLKPPIRSAAGPLQTPQTPVVGLHSQDIEPASLPTRRADAPVRRVEEPDVPPHAAQDERESRATRSGGFFASLRDQFGSAWVWVISSVVHIVLLALLALIVIRVQKDEPSTVILTTDLAEKTPEKKPRVRDIFRNTKEVEWEEVVENPVFTHEKVEITDHMETDNEMDLNSARGHEDAISDIPLGGTGVVGNIGVGGGGAGAYGFRTGGGRRKAVGRFGGSRATEGAVDAALEWLARNQQPEGYWSVRKHEGTYAESGHVGVTGAALLAFLGAGHTEKAGKFKDVVRKAVAYLIGKQDAKGMIGHNAGRHQTGDGSGYNQAMAGLALAEAYGMARVPATGKAAQKAVDYSCDGHQVKYNGWRYGPKYPTQDLSVSGWFIMQLKSAKVAGLQVPGESFQGAIALLDRLEVKPKDADANYSGGVFIYSDGRGPPRPATCAMGMLGRMFLGFPPNQLHGGAQSMMVNLPDWNQPNFYYWYYGTLVMFQMGGDYWKAWNTAMRDALVNNQRKGGPEDGSWDPRGGLNGSDKKAGRAWCTAAGALCLEVYYRYLPIYKR